MIKKKKNEKKIKRKYFLRRKEEFSLFLTNYLINELSLIKIFPVSSGKILWREKNKKRKKKKIN